MTPMMIAHSLTLSRGKKIILKNLSLSINRGDFVGLVGPNGVGKSTLLMALAGIHPATSGTINIGPDQSDIDTLSIKDRARRLCYLPQFRPVYWAMPVEDIVMLGRYAWGHPTYTQKPHHDDQMAVETAMTKTGILHLRNRSIDTLSGGERSRVHLTRALAGQSPILLADEPTNALDPQHQHQIMTILKTHAETQGTTIAAIHDLDLAVKYCTHLLVLHEGQLIANGSPQSVLTKDLIERVFHMNGRFIDTDKETTLILSPL